MLYTEAERAEVTAELKKRRLRVWLPTALLILLAVGSFVWFRLHHSVEGWPLTALLTVAAGGFCIFFCGVYIRPVAAYRDHIRRMLDGRMAETSGVLKAVDEQLSDKDGVDCFSLVVNVGEKNDSEDDRLFYLDALKGKPPMPVGSRVTVRSNDRMVSDMEWIKEP